MPISTLNGALPAAETDDGNKLAFEALYARDSKELWALAYAACADSDAAMDCVQTAFTEFQARGLDPEEMGAATWLQMRVRELAKNAKPGERREPASGPDGFVAVRAALDGLPPDVREVAALRYALDYTPEQIAAVLGRPSGEVAGALSACRRRLAERLAADGTTEAA